MRFAPLLLLSSAIGLCSLQAFAQSAPSGDAPPPADPPPAAAADSAPATAIAVPAPNAWQTENAAAPVVGTATRVLHPRAGRKVAADPKAVPAFVKARGPKAKVLRNPDEPVAWFPGFIRLESGVTRVFLEVSKRVEITEHRAEGRITYRLKGAVAPERVNRMPLVTAFFATPIERVTLVSAGPDADLVIDMKKASESSYRVLDTPRGIVLQVDFPAVSSGPVVLPPPAAATTTTTQVPGSADY